jgi:class 3 adenylate cyclase
MSKSQFQDPVFVANDKIRTLPELTIVFADLTGSTGVFESLGNAMAAEVVTHTTRWIADLCGRSGGRLVKFLGDAVLLAFTDNHAAVQAVTEMQRLHRERLVSGVYKSKMKIKIGMARGDVVEQNGDIFGDAVNVASRLCDLCGVDQILVSDQVISQLPRHSDVRYLNLGAMNIRGKSEPISVFRLEWLADTTSEFLTQPSDLDAGNSSHGKMTGSIELRWLDTRSTFQAGNMPIFLGRGTDAQFVVNDPRVSRLHAKIDLHGNAFVLEDISSYGTWVRFASSESVIALRRQECVLLDKGEIALGASFDDFSVPTLSYRFDGISSF